VYIYTNKPSKVIFDLTKLLMTDEVTRIDGTALYSRSVHRWEKRRVLAVNGFFLLKLLGRKVKVAVLHHREHGAFLYFFLFFQ
jgi:hypothetical protein